MNNEYQDMKNVILKMAMCALIVCTLPTAIDAQDWQTNTMQGSGSNYSSPITPVGATNVDQQATTTYSSPRRIGGRHNDGDFGPGQDGGVQDPNSPIGSEWILFAFAALAAGVMVIKKQVINTKNSIL